MPALHALQRALSIHAARAVPRVLSDSLRWRGWRGRHCSRTNGLRRQVESLAETERVAALHLHIGDENRQLLLRDAEQLRDRVPPSNFERFRVLSQLSALQQLSDAAREVAHPEVRRQLMGRMSAVCYTARAVAV